MNVFIKIAKQKNIVVLSVN